MSRVKAGADTRTPSPIHDDAVADASRRNWLSSNVDQMGQAEMKKRLRERPMRNTGYKPNITKESEGVGKLGEDLETEMCLSTQMECSAAANELPGKSENHEVLATVGGLPGWLEKKACCYQTAGTPCRPIKQGPEICTGFLKDGKHVHLKEGQEITIPTDYNLKGDENLITMSYKKLPVDLKAGNTILCADGTITLTVLSCDLASGTVRCRYYDTFLMKYQERATEKNGSSPFSLTTQIMDSDVVPVTPHDVSVDALVSPSDIVLTSTAALERM
ncbi:hypothetical protein Taro_000022 [Colocasia esculenta]|uniref:Pyruvate kinase barrel domain-containing protein n=1 Tax=Colocasia esculenta TaxID=4460 RepID=A0A843TFI1_COLES|nr:hypothetical protein [Colocasia esculenta]